MKVFSSRPILLPDIGVNDFHYSDQAFKFSPEVSRGDGSGCKQSGYLIERRKNDRRLSKPDSLEDVIKQKIEQYFDQLDGYDPVSLHALVISEIEKPFLEAALKLSGNNQTKAAKVLGISRSTLRKKMELYKIC